MSSAQVYLSRRNLLTLLAKLDRAAAGGFTHCTLVKRDAAHPVYPQSHDSVIVTAVENADYYTDRQPGLIVETT